MRLLLLGILWLGVSCDSCRNLDCVPPFDYFQFIYVDSDGNDLLSGAPPKYEVDDVKVYSIDSNSRAVFASVNAIGTSAGIDVQLSYSTERWFLEIKGKVTDTLDFKFKTHKTECCGEFSEIDKTTLNGVVYTGNFPMEIVERN